MRSLEQGKKEKKRKENEKKVARVESHLVQIVGRACNTGNKLGSLSSLSFVPFDAIIARFFHFLNCRRPSRPFLSCKKRTRGCAKGSSVKGCVATISQWVEAIVLRIVSTRVALPRCHHHFQLVHQTRSS